MKAIKHFVFIVLILSQNTLLTQDYWIRKQSPVTSLLFKCVFTDTLNGWACGESGVILHTSNGGESWIQQITNVDYSVEDICFLNNRVGWSIGNDFVHYRSIIFETSNGGTNWSLNPYPDSTVILDAIYFLDSLNGYMGGSGGIILKTTDAGNTWKIMSVDSSYFYKFPIRSFKFFDGRIGVACGGANDFGGGLWKTTNYGYNWTAFLIAPEPIYDVVYLDSVNAYAAGGDPELGAEFVTTRNNWVQYDFTALEFFGIAQAIAMRTQNEIWMPLGFSERWAVSIDAGQHWEMIINHDSDAVNDAVFIDSTHGWAVGTYGRVYKFNKEIIGIKNYGKGTPSAFKLYQNYPNPFNPVTKIKYQIPDVSRSSSSGSGIAVRLVLFDVLGRQVKTLVDENKKPGTYEMEWDASGFPSGVYFYKLSAGLYSQTKKMVLLK
jgi:photosystem II stability/assembly factor-like uncharacterized protein